MLLQFISDLVNDETAALRERVMGLPEKRPFLLNVENTERNARKNVIALGEAAPLQFSANCRLKTRAKAGSSSNRSKCESGLIRRAISRECTPSPGPYSAITRGRLKSILLATRSTIALELGTIEAI